MMLGYLRAEDNIGAFDEAGFFLTGDIGRIIDGSYLVITGRKKDLIIRLGENLSPKEIEDALHTHPLIEAAAVVGMPDPVTGERICAFIVTRGGVDVSLRELDEFLLAAGLSRRKVPEHVVLIDALPVSLQGKVLKQVLRERAAEIAKQKASAAD
jgi:acyl-CoA synthetase (AMP-forming)/AMP-acid ligase II